MRIARPLHATNDRERDQQVAKAKPVNARSSKARQPNPTNSPQSSGGGTHGGDTEPARRERIAVAAYYNAERSGFAGNTELDDWLDAEKAIDGATPADAAAQLDQSADASELIYPEDIDEWAERLDVTREQLRVAIRQVGSRVDDITRFLGNPDVR
jgi:hypothetical protein